MGHNSQPGIARHIIGTACAYADRARVPSRFLDGADSALRAPRLIEFRWNRSSREMDVEWGEGERWRVAFNVKIERER